MRIIQVKLAIANGEAMTGNKNHHSTKFEQLGEENVRSAIALEKYSGKQLTAAQQWLDKCEQKRELLFKVENKKANMVLVIAAAIGALIFSIAAIA
jgi:dTDP-4-dehydrorhamnose reductase